MRSSLAFCLSRLALRQSNVTSFRHPVSFSAVRTMATEGQPLAAAPAAGQTIVHNDQRYTTVKEGLAYILVPESAKTDAGGKKASDGGQGVQQVFYNPIQQFNRDLSVLAIKAYGQEVMEKKKAMFAKKLLVFAGKKRKRCEHQDGDERHQKLGKLSETSKPQEDMHSANTEHPTTQTTAPGQDEMLDVEADVTGALHSEPTAASEQEETLDPPGSTKHASATSAPTFKILDALSATGLRALRYSHEIPFVTSVTSNDLLASAVKSIKLNVEHNKLEDKINVTQGDALAHMYGVIASELSHSQGRHNSHKSEKYDVIDLDPYGTAAPFFDAALQSVRDDGGLLCVTCTDAGVWASNGYPEKTFALYGGIPMKGNHSHEAGLRIILNGIATSAARYGLAIEPLLSLSIDFYCRVFIRVKKSPALVKFQAGKTMVVYCCDQGCGSWATQLLLKNKATPNKNGSGMFYKHSMAAAPTSNQNCEHCGYKMHLAGPMYAGRIHSAEFIQRILDDLPNVSTDIYHTTERIRGMLQTALEELIEPRAEVTTPAVDQQGAQDTGAGEPAKQPLQSKDDAVAAVDPYPFFFTLGQLAGVLHSATPGDDPIRGALRHLGYQVTRSHCKPGSMKTDAPWSVVWEVMREWIRQKAPVKEESIKPSTAAYKLLRLDEKAKDQQQEANGGEGKEEKPRLNVVFDEKLGRETSREKLVRYQVNPRENWGPMNRARGK